MSDKPEVIERVSSWWVLWCSIKANLWHLLGVKASVVEWRTPSDALYAVETLIDIADEKREEGKWYGYRVYDRHGRQGIIGYRFGTPLGYRYHCYFLTRYAKPEDAFPFQRDVNPRDMAFKWKWLHDGKIPLPPDDLKKVKETI